MLKQTIDTGAGNDRVRLDLGPVDPSGHVQSDIKLGAGNDHLTIDAHGPIAKTTDVHITADAGAGKNTVTLLGQAESLLDNHLLDLTGFTKPLHA